MNEICHLDLHLFCNTAEYKNMCYCGAGEDTNQSSLILCGCINDQNEPDFFIKVLRRELAQCLLSLSAHPFVTDGVR